MAQRSPAQPRRDPAEHLPPAPLQYDELSFSRLARESGGIADNVMRSMEPGKSYDVEIAIPGDHTRGTYWYHPHHHGGADIQMASGMVGALIVEGDFDAVPEIARARERTLVLSQVVFDHLGTVEDFGTLFPRNGHALLLDQRAADAHDRDASGRGAALAPAARRLSGHPPGGAGTPRAARDRLRRNRPPPCGEPGDDGPGVRASAPTCWCRRGLPGPMCWAACLTIRAIPLRPGRWPASSWRARRSR